MAANNNTKRTTANKKSKARPSKNAPDKAVPADTPAPVAAADVPNAPTATTMRLDLPTPSEAGTIAPAPTPSVEPAPAKKLSALDAAARVLGERGQAMNCQELIATMAARGYWSSPNGRTPAATLYAALLRELQTKGDKARFCKTGRGTFALRPTV
jgi:hypothetical protein